MFGLPESTVLRKQIPKTAIYDKFPTEVQGKRKTSFDNDISRIYVINEISPASVRIQEGEEVKSIFVVQVDIKSKKYNEQNLSLISRLFGQHIVIALHLNDEYNLMIYRTKLLSSGWISQDDKQLKIDGLNLDRTWESLVSQISGVIPDEWNTLDEQISIEAEKEKLRKQIKDLDSRMNREIQSKKKHELFEQIQEKRRKLEEL